MSHELDFINEYIPRIKSEKLVILILRRKWKILNLVKAVASAPEKIPETPQTNLEYRQTYLLFTFLVKN